MRAMQKSFLALNLLGGIKTRKGDKMNDIESLLQSGPLLNFMWFHDRVVRQMLVLTEQGNAFRWLSGIEHSSA